MTVTDQTERDLLARAQSGEPATFAALKHYLDGRVRRFIWHLIGYSTEEDDIVQDVFTALYVSLDRIHPPEKLSPFLFRVTRNRCYDLLRRQGRYRTSPIEEHTITDARPRPDESTHWSLLYLQVRQAMEKLPEPQRQALILYAVEGFSYEEIAEALQIPIGTVKSRLHHAKQQLRRLTAA